MRLARGRSSGQGVAQDDSGALSRKVCHLLKPASASAAEATSRGEPVGEVGRAMVLATTRKATRSNSYLNERRPRTRFRRRLGSVEDSPRCSIARKGSGEGAALGQRISHNSIGMRASGRARQADDGDGRIQVKVSFADER